MPVVLVNLESAVERGRHMDAQLAAAGVVATRVGVDLRQRGGEHVAQWTAAHFPDLSFDLTSMCAAEAGCWASHLLAWRELLQGDASACAVIEDDTVLAPTFAQIVATLGTQRAFDVVYLGTSSRNISSRRRTRVGELWLHEPLGVIFNTWGYVVTRAYVERFFATPARIDMPIDHFLGGRARHAKPRIAVVRPAVVAEDVSVGLRSQIEPYATRVDRHRAWQSVRRAVLASRLSDLYYSLYRWL